MNVLCKLRAAFTLMIVYLVPDLIIIISKTKKSTYFNFKLHILKKIMEVPLKCAEGSPSALFTLLSPENRISAPPPGVPLHCIYSIIHELHRHFFWGFLVTVMIELDYL